MQYSQTRKRDENFTETNEMTKLDGGLVVHQAGQFIDVKNWIEGDWEPLAISVKPNDNRQLLLQKYLHLHF